MKKLLIIFLFLSFIGLSYAQFEGGGFTSGQFWFLDGSALRPSDSTWELGASANRILKGWFSDLDTTTLTIGSFASGNLTVRQDLFVNGNDFNLGSGTATSTYSGTATSTMQAGFSFASGGVASSKGFTLTGGVFQTSRAILSSASATSTFSSSGISVEGGGLASSRGLTLTGGIIQSSGNLNITSSATSTLTASGLSVAGGGLASSKGLTITGGIIRTDVNTLYTSVSTSTLPNLTSAFTFATSTTNTPLLTLSTKSSRYGRIGIGTSSPSALFAIQALNSSNQVDNIFYIGSSTANNFVVDNHGNVGIGMAVPGYRVDVNGVINAGGTGSENSGTLRVGNGSSGAFTIVGSDTTGNVTINNANTVGGDIQLQSRGVNTVMFKQSGNVGIGTAAPGQKLEVSGAGSVFSLFDGLRISGDDTDNTIFQSTTNNNLVITISGASASTNYVGLGDSTTGASLVVRRDGKVGIGTTTPASTLSVKQGADTKLGGLMLGASDGDTRSAYMNTAGVLNFGGGDSSTGSFNTATLSAAGAWANASDIAYKENIIDIAYGLDAIMRLQPRFYTMKGSNKSQIGFVAQELEKIIPEVVEGEEGSKGISYGNLVAATVKAIQEQQKEIEELKKQIYGNRNYCAP